MRWSFFILGLWITIIGPGNIEGRFFPAASPAVVTSVEEDPENPEWVTISGSSEKLREGCSPVRLDWYRGERGQLSAPVDWDWGPPIVRRGGEFEFVNWEIRAAPEVVFRDETYADVIHQCRVFGVRLPWLTVTRWWN